MLGLYGLMIVLKKNVPSVSCCDCVVGITVAVGVPVVVDNGATDVAAIAIGLILKC